MKLLKKQEIDIQKAQARKMDIDEAVKLAKKVDSLRKLSATEEENIGKFRAKVLEQLNADINTLQATKTTLADEVDALVKRSQIPFDLQQERDKTKVETIALEVQKKNFAHKEEEFQLRENAFHKHITEKNENLLFREETLKEKELLCEHYLITAKKSFNETEILKQITKDLHIDAEKDIESKYRKLQNAEDDFAIKLIDFNNEKQRVAQDKRDILNEQLHIQSQQETLKQVWEKIKRLKQ